MVESGNNALTAALLEALPYIKYLAGKTIVIKIGGSTLGSGDTDAASVLSLVLLVGSLAVLIGLRERWMRAL